MNEQDEDGLQTDEAEDSGNEPASPMEPLLPHHIHRGWWVVLVGAGVLALTTFADSNLADFLFEPPGGDAPRYLLSIGSPILLFALLPLRPLIGLLVDRQGPIGLVAMALLIGGIAYAILAIIGPNWQSYGAAIVVGGVMAAVAGIALLATVANLFARHVGLAFAIALAGVSTAVWWPGLLGSFFLLPLSTRFDGFGTVHIATVLFVGGVLFALGIAMALAMRRWRPWGEEGWGSRAMILDAPAASTGDEPDNHHGREAARLKLGAIFSDKSIYLYIAAAGLSGTALTPFLFPMNDVFVNLSATTLAAWLSLPALLAVGVLSDRFNRKLIVLAMLAILITVTIPSLLDLGRVVNSAAVGLLITGFGARIPAILALQWDYFGKRHFGLLYGIQASASAFIAAIWNILTGFISDVFGLGSGVVLVWSALPLVIALLLILLMKRPQYGGTTAESGTQVAA